MLKNKHIVIITPDFLQGYGLKMLLEEYFSAEYCDIFLSVKEVDNAISHSDIIFTNVNLYYLLHERLMPFNSKLILISDNTSTDTSDISLLQTAYSQDVILNNLHLLLQHKLQKSKNNQEQKIELSEREREVLTLIAKGELNKTIADKLYISLNTVLTHRKNITAKLGIKTVSGLTVYAILNGLITTGDLS